MTAYHLYTHTKPVKWYDPFRLAEQAPGAGAPKPPLRVCPMAIARLGGLRKGRSAS